MSSWADCRVFCALALVAFVAGCGFEPTGQTPLPAQMKNTYVDSGQPYGDLENMLRGEIARRGDTVVDDRAKATAVLQILETDRNRRVIAVNADGRPIEYALNYKVRFRLLDGSGKELLAPQTLKFSREYAYSITIELGTAREENDILTELQREAVRSIFARLEALGRKTAQPPRGSSDLFKRLK